MKKRKQSRPTSLPIAPLSYAPPTPPRDDDLQTPVIKPLASPMPLLAPSRSSSSGAAAMAASTRRHSYPIPQTAAAPSSLHDIENEMAYTKDSLATLAVMYDSLRQAYDHGKPQLRFHPTRLDAMEKELLSAYDDLELQVIHMKKQIAKLESSWFAWKSQKTPPS
ncbi:hypothetical protein BC940DRAFT_168084 [Gongronella butleri]|nr:hypothetical protein BC940DRAFT_168084 [Gongronella butleri]